jgi:bifunctional DNase/RNase
LAETYFHHEFFERLPFSAKNRSWIKLLPYAVQMSADGRRPILILKDHSGTHSLPVPLNPLEAGIALTQSNKSIAPLSPHKVTESLLQSLKIQFSSCVFSEIKGSYQYVTLTMKKDKSKTEVGPLKVRADEAMSFCLHFNIPLYATQTFMDRSRTLAFEVQDSSQALFRNGQRGDHGAGTLAESVQKYIQ